MSMKQERLRFAARPLRDRVLLGAAAMSAVCLLATSLLVLIERHGQHTGWTLALTAIIAVVLFIPALVIASAPLVRKAIDAHNRYWMRP